MNLKQGVQRQQLTSEAAPPCDAPRLVRPALGAVEELASVWQLLPVRNPMQDYLWARACAEAFTNGAVQVVVVGHPTPQGIAALVRHDGFGPLRPLGAELYEPTEFAYADRSAAEELAEAIARLNSPVFIEDMFADSVMVECLQRSCGRRMSTILKLGHPWLDLDDSWLDPESHLNSGRRSDFRRARRKAEELGRLRCDITAPDLNSLHSRLGEAFQVEAANWKGRHGSALATDPDVGGFYRHYSEAVCRRGELHIGLLWIGDRAVAMQVAITQNNCFWLLKAGYDEEFSRCSPGSLLMVESLRYAAQLGCSRYEFMGESEPWNQVWTQQLHPAVSLRIHRSGWRGWVTVAADCGRAAIASRRISQRKHAK